MPVGESIRRKYPSRSRQEDIQTPPLKQSLCCATNPKCWDVHSKALQLYIKHSEACLASSWGKNVWIHWKMRMIIMSWFVLHNNGHQAHVGGRRWGEPGQTSPGWITCTCKAQNTLPIMKFKQTRPWKFHTTVSLKIKTAQPDAEWVPLRRLHRKNQ